jgi:hypothetical protein
MVAAVRRIIIDVEAKKSLREAYEYIRKQSLQNAENVRSGILNSIKALSLNPENIHLINTKQIKTISFGLMKFTVTESPIMFQLRRSGFYVSVIQR